MTRAILGLSAAFVVATGTLPASAHSGAGAVHLLTQTDHTAVFVSVAVFASLCFLIWRLARY